MQGFKNLPSITSADVQLFTTTGVGATAYQLWQKPKGASIVFMLAIGGGAGGGTGRSKGAAVAGGGGGGGACSGGAKFICPALFLPDVMYVQVGDGGAGGIAGATTSDGVSGGAGTHSYILTSPTAVLPNVILYSGAGTIGGGGGGNEHFSRCRWHCSYYCPYSAD